MRNTLTYTDLTTLNNPQTKAYSRKNRFFSERGIIWLKIAAGLLVFWAIAGYAGWSLFKQIFN